MNKSALYVKNILLYAGAFFLLVEWLLPLNEVTDTNQIQYFILFVAYCFLCLTFRLPFIVMTLGSILFILFSLQNLYFQGAFFSSDWLPRLFEILQSDAQSIMEWNIANLSFEMRSTLFFVLLLNDSKPINKKQGNLFMMNGCEKKAIAQLYLKLNY